MVTRYIRHHQLPWNQKSFRKKKQAPEQFKPYLTFPLKDGTVVPWLSAEAAYRSYVALYGDRLSMLSLAEQGGFTVKEFRAWSNLVDLDGTRIEL